MIEWQMCAEGMLFCYPGEATTPTMKAEASGHWKASKTPGPQQEETILPMSNFYYWMGVGCVNPRQMKKSLQRSGCQI
jgi:hypothetical protein